MQQVSLASTGGFSSFFLDYINEKEQLKKFYSFEPSLTGIGEALKSRQFEHRETLVAVLKEQYAGENLANIDLLLKPTTFTVTTGHQLNVATGPLYVIYKIVSTINLAKKLKETYPDFDFVPVYWMATEDHDHEEIASFQLFSKKYTWQTEQKGAVGQMNPSEIVGALDCKDLPAFMVDAYQNEPNLSAAVRKYMHHLFGQHGLVSLDADHPQLKHLFKDVMEADIFKNKAFATVNATSSELNSLGYKTQISPREINFFYLKPGFRERIIATENGFSTLNADLSWTAEEIKAEIENHPERFSPNVVLRPMYQETILPNLAYLGGPSEVVYWLQLKANFEADHRPFPVLLPRNFATIVTAPIQKKMEKLGIRFEELAQEESQLKKDFVAKKSENDLSLISEINQMMAILEGIKTKAEKVDQTMGPVVASEGQKIKSSLESLEKRIKKAEERNLETEVTQVLGIKAKLFPNASFQERVDNYLNYAINDPDFLNKLFKTFDPLDFKMNILHI